MNTTNKIKIWLTLLSIAVICLCWKDYRDGRDYRVLCSYAHNLTMEAEVIEQSRDGGRHGATPSVTATCLKTVVEFQIPPESTGTLGSKYFDSAPQRTQYYATQLQRMVARERTAAIKDLIEYFRTRTGEDLGDDPLKWIQEYAHKKSWR